MLDHIDDYNRDAIREQAVERFSYERVGERFCELYERVLSEDSKTE